MIMERIYDKLLNKPDTEDWVLGFAVFKATHIMLELEIEEQKMKEMLVKYFKLSEDYATRAIAEEKEARELDF